MHKIYTKKTGSDLINMGIFYFSQYCYYVRCDYIRRMRAEKINICRHISLLSPNSLPSPNPTTQLCTSHTHTHTPTHTHTHSHIYTHTCTYILTYTCNRFHYPRNSTHCPGLDPSHLTGTNSRGPVLRYPGVSSHEQRSSISTRT